MRPNNYWNPTIILRGAEDREKIKKLCADSNISFAKWCGFVIRKEIEKGVVLDDKR